MSLLIRKTKKCCVKLLRKIQQSTSVTGFTNVDHQDQHKHRKQFSCNNNQSRNNSSQVCNTSNNNNNNNNNKRCTKNEKMSKNNNGTIKQTNMPTRRKDQLSSHHNSHHHHHHHRRSHYNLASDSFVYERCTEDTQSQTTTDEVDSVRGHSSDATSSDADDEDDITKSTYPSTRQNIRTRLQNVQLATNLNNNNNYTELRPTRTANPLTNAVPSSTTPTAPAPSSKCSGKRFYAMATSRFAQEDIVFTENQIYIGLKEMMNAQNSTATNRSQKLIEKTPFNMVSNMDTQNQGIHKNYAKTFHDNSLTDQILFEKVKFDANKRYLQTSPVSTNSASSRIGDFADPLNYRSFLYDHTSHPRTSTMYINDEHDTTFTQYFPSNQDFNTNQPRHGARRLRNEVPGSNNDESSWQQAYDNDNGYVEQNSILDNHRNRIRSSSPTSPPRTIHQLPPTTLDTLMLNNSYGNNGAYYYERASASFSRRSSISTTETWVDDESFENSFNEELEKRCEAPSVFCR